MTAQKFNTILHKGPPDPRPDPSHRCPWQEVRFIDIKSIQLDWFCSSNDLVTLKLFWMAQQNILAHFYQMDDAARKERNIPRFPFQHILYPKQRNVTNSRFLSLVDPYKVIDKTKALSRGWAPWLNNAQFACTVQLREDTLYNCSVAMFVKEFKPVLEETGGWGSWIPLQPG